MPFRDTAQVFYLNSTHFYFHQAKYYTIFSSFSMERSWFFWSFLTVINENLKKSKFLSGAYFISAKKSISAREPTSAMQIFLSPHRNLLLEG